ncbi:glycosyltransferase family 4 protein [Planktomarina temperata]|nr:glycosyltransferase family 4 protein [Planktomarina temperata]
MLSKVLTYSTKAKSYYSNLYSGALVNVSNSVLKKSDIDFLRSERKHYDVREGEKKIVSVFLGRVTKGKNLEVLCEQFAANVIPGKLIVIGDGDLLIKLMLQYGQNNNIDFVGRKRKQDAWEYMLGADIFILPGLGGLAIQEALACGLYVICNYGDGTEEDLIKNRLNGIVLNNFTAQSLKNEMEYFINNNSSERFSYNSILLDHFTIERYSDRLLEALK